MTQKNLAILFLISSTAVFALVNIVVKNLAGLPTSTIVTFRGVVALIFTLVVLFSKKLPIFGTNKKILFLRGLFGTGAVYCFFKSLHLVPLATAVTLLYLFPLFNIINSHIFLKEKATLKQWMLFILSFIGVLLIRGIDQTVPWEHLLIGIGSGLCASLGHICIRAASKENHPLTISFYFPFVTALIFLPISIVNWQPIPMGAWKWFLIIGVGMQTGQFLISKAYQLASAPDISNFSNTGILFAVLIGLFVYGETPTLAAGIGIGLILVSSILSTRN